jgi:putative transcriptional regulator
MAPAAAGSVPALRYFDEPSRRACRPAPAKRCPRRVHCPFGDFWIYTSNIRVAASKIFDIPSDLFDFSTARTMALRNLIRCYRFDDGEMTQQQLADLCGVSRQTINAIERNKYSPSLELAFKIAHVFGVTIEDIFLYDADPEGGKTYKEGATIYVTFADSSGGGMDSEGDGM